MQKTEETTGSGFHVEMTVPKETKKIILTDQAIYFNSNTGTWSHYPTDQKVTIDGKKMNKLETSFWFVEIDGEPMAGGFLTKREAIDDLVKDYAERSWDNLKKAGYTVSRYKVEKI